MKLVKVEKIEVVNITIGEKTFQDMKLVGNIDDYIKKYKGQKGTITVMDLNYNPVDKIFSMFTEVPDNPVEGHAVICASGKLYEAVKSSNSQLDNLRERIIKLKSDSEIHTVPKKNGHINGMMEALAIIEGKKATIIKLDREKKK